jgi:hypothetical protein
MYDMGRIEWWFRGGKTIIYKARKRGQGARTPVPSGVPMLTTPDGATSPAPSAAVSEGNVKVDLAIRGRRINVRRAPAPDTILWGNLPVSRSSRVCRQSCTTCLSIVIILVAFAFVYGANLVSSAARTIAGLPASADVSSMTATIQCDTVKAVAGLSTDPTAASTPLYAVFSASDFVSGFNSSAILGSVIAVPTSADRAFGMPSALLDLLVQNVSACGNPVTVPSALITTYNISRFANATNAAYSLTSSTNWQALCGGSANATINAGLSLQSILLQISECPVLFGLTSATSNCYCEEQLIANPVALFQSSAAPTYLPSIPTELNENAACLGWLENYVVFTALVATASIIQVTVNLINLIFLRSTSDYELHRSRIEMGHSAMLRMFVAQFMNVAILVLVVGATLPYIPSSQLLGTSANQYSDFTAGWYANQSPMIILTIFIQSIGMNSFNAGYWGWFVCTRSCRPYGSAKTQQELQVYHTPPEFDLVRRYADLLTVSLWIMRFRVM